MGAEDLLIGEDGQLPLPWLAEPLAGLLERQRGHALLLHAAAGQGALPLAVSLAQSWLCEAGEGRRPACGRCAACRLVQARAHPDLQLLLPELQRRELGWPFAGDKAEGGDSSRKPSRQIRVEEVRSLIDWVFKTSARGRGKVAVLHPGELINTISANALLKTLEEPPAGTRIVITAADPARLLPTVLSRCNLARVPLPTEAEALPWLAAQGVADPGVLLAATAGRPLDALALQRAGIGAAAWKALPAALAQGQPALQGWPLPQALDTLLKLAHDAMAVATGAAPRYFPAGSLPATLAADALPGLNAWSAELRRVARHATHPWNEGVLIDALVAQAARALAPPARTRPRPGSAAPGAGFVTLPA